MAPKRIVHCLYKGDVKSKLIYKFNHLLSFIIDDIKSDTEIPRGIRIIEIAFDKLSKILKNGITKTILDCD